MARLPLLGPGDLPAQAQAVYRSISRRRGEVPAPFRLLLHSPEAASRVARLGEYVRFRSALPPALREVAVLATARALDCAYEWAYHEPLARRAGVGEEAIEALRKRRAPRGLDPDLATVVSFALEMVQTGRVAEGTFRRALELLGPRGVVDLAVCVGYYTLLGLVMGAMEVAPPGGTPF